MKQISAGVRYHKFHAGHRVHTDILKDSLPRRTKERGGVGGLKRVGGRSRMALAGGWRSWPGRTRHDTGRKAVCIFHAGAASAVIENIYMLFMGHTCFRNQAPIPTM